MRFLLDSKDICSALKLSIVGKDLTAGLIIHSLIVKRGLDRSAYSAYMGTQLIRFFAACGSLTEAEDVFNKLTLKNVFSWCAIISAHSKSNSNYRAISLYYQMQQSGVKPDGHIFAAVLQACTNSAKGKLIHMNVIEDSFQNDEYICSSLLHMYSQCGLLDDARWVFDVLTCRSLVTWSAMISGYAQHGRGWEALDLFCRMHQVGLVPDFVTFSSTLQACASIEAIIHGNVIFSYAIEEGCHVSINVGNTLLDMYAKCGSLQDAQKVFSTMVKHDVVTWSAMVSGYVQHGHFQAALNGFQEMQRSGVDPNEATFASILGACSSITAIDEGKVLHAHVIESAFQLNASVGSALVYMYLKCGSVLDAQYVFQMLPLKNLVTWTAMIEGLAKHGYLKTSLELFKAMQKEGVTPDEGTITSLLSACGHAGLTEAGCYVFQLVTKLYGMSPTLDHLNCMIDLLARSGFFREAEDLLLTMSSNSNWIGWLTLLWHCENQGNTVMGKRCFREVANLNCVDSAAYVIMSKMYLHDNSSDSFQKLTYVW